MSEKPTSEEQADGAQASSAEEQVERDLDELNKRRPQAPPPDLERERDEYLELAQRTKADFENYRKRVARETSEALARGKAELARELLPVVDNLERALAAGDRDGDLAKGVELVLDELRAKLRAAGVEGFDPTGEKFDPAVHEALDARDAGDAESGVVVETLAKGYRLNGQVLRPARVVVAK